MFQMENILFLDVPKFGHITLMCLNIGTPNNHYFPFGTNGKIVVLGVPIRKHFRVIFSDKFQSDKGGKFFKSQLPLKREEKQK